LEIASQAGSALAAAHAAGIVHRDLKSENLFLVPSADVPTGERVKVLDFGIAKIKRASGTHEAFRTQTGILMGSPAYMSPEQCKDSADVDLRSDIYSFATIVYEMLAGRTPHVATSGTELLVMHLTANPRPLRELSVDVPVHVEAAIARGLARAREDRFDSIAEFVGALRGDAGGSTTILEQSPAPKVRTGVAASLASPTAPTALLRAATTFSRASGEIGSESSDEALLRATRPRRWRYVAIGGVAVAGLMLFLLVRPGRNAAPRATNGIAATFASPAAPTQQALPVNAGPAVLPGKPDAGVALPASVGTPVATKRPPASARQPTASSVTKKKRKVEEEWVVH
jgi:eukaryotic-like serine/threonine-protein kinase